MNQNVKKRTSEKKERVKLAVHSLENSSDDNNINHRKYEDSESIGDDSDEKLTDVQLKPSTKTKEDSSSQTSNKSTSTSKVLLKKDTTCDIKHSKRSRKHEV